MSDLISRQSAIDAVGSMLRRKFGIGGDLAEITLAGLPSVQEDIDLSAYSDKLWRAAYERGKKEAQPEVIRCKDCKWKEGSECVRFADIRPFPTDFCSRAERRTDDSISD